MCTHESTAVWLLGLSHRVRPAEDRRDGACDSGSPSAPADTRAVEVSGSNGKLENENIKMYLGGSVGWSHPFILTTEVNKFEEPSDFDTSEFPDSSDTRKNGIENKDERNCRFCEAFFTAADS